MTCKSPQKYYKKANCINKRRFILRDSKPNEKVLSCVRSPLLFTGDALVFKSNSGILLFENFTEDVLV